MFRSFILGGIASLAVAGTIVDQGQPGRQGPWPVYIQLLPDGGGGGATTGGGGAALWADGGTLHPGKITPSPATSGIAIANNLVMSAPLTDGGCFEYGWDIEQATGGLYLNTEGCGEQSPQVIFQIDGNATVISPFASGAVGFVRPVETTIGFTGRSGAPFEAPYPSSFQGRTSDNATNNVTVSSNVTAYGTDTYGHEPGIEAHDDANAYTRMESVGYSSGSVKGWGVFAENVGISAGTIGYYLDNTSLDGFATTMCSDPASAGCTEGIADLYCPAGTNPRTCTTIRTVDKTGNIYSNNTFFSDGGGYCFPDHTCQTTAATGGGTNYWIDGGVIVSTVPSIQLDPAFNGVSWHGDLAIFRTSGSTQNVFNVGSSSGLVTGHDSINQLRYQFGGTNDAFFRDSLYSGAIIHADGGFEAGGQKGTNFANGAAAGELATFPQIQESLSVSGATPVGLVVTGNEIIARQDGTSNQGLTFTRAKMVVTCLTAGTGGGTTTLTLRDDVAPLNITTVTFNCACTPGASSTAAVVTGLSQADNSSFVIRTSGTANTDCSSFPGLMANAMLSRN